MRHLLALLVMFAAPAAAAPDLILTNGKLWTGDAAKPSAEAIAVEGERIAAVGRTREMLRLKGPNTRVVDLGGKRVIPGFIDAHTHFENATDWFYEARLMDVEDEPAMLARLAGAARRVPKGMWITGTDWGGEAMRREWRKGDRKWTAFVPSLAKVDAVTPDHPVFIRRHDGAAFLNSAGLRLMRFVKHRPQPGGGDIVRDPDGQPAGLLLGSAAQIAATSIPPKSRAATLIAARALVRQLNSLGITSIHDISRVDALSQRQTFPVHVERSNSDSTIFGDLRETGDLTVRVYPMVTLATWVGLAGEGIQPGSGDAMIRYGALKGFIDGWLMEEPWTNRPDWSGDFTYRVTDEPTQRGLTVAADAAGWDVAMHQIGDNATRLYLDWIEAAIAANGPRDRRIRLIHLWFPAPKDIERAGRLRAFADITPYHLVRERDVLEGQIGPARSRTAFAWRTMMEKGMRLNIVSDWPGSFDKSEIAPVDPMANIFIAVARTDSETPDTPGWRPEQGLTIEEALRAYTVNPADAAHEAADKGSLTPGKLADLVVLSDDILSPAFAKAPKRLLDTKVVATYLGGRLVHEAAAK